MQPSTQFRLALALVVVKSIPRGRSFAAHIAELCRRFPLDSKSSGNDVERWHERVLFLEDELRAVKRKADADAADIAILRASKNDAAPQPQKKRKKTANGVVTEKNTCKEALLTTCTPDISSSQTVLQAYERAMHIADLLTNQDTPATDKGAYTQLFLSTSVDAVRTLSGALESAISSNFAPSQSNNSTISNVDFVLSSLLERTLSSQCFGDDIVSTLLSDIIIPCLKSFRTLSLQAIEETCRREASPNYNDLRPEVLLLLKHAIQVLAPDTHQETTGELLSAAATHAVHALSALFIVEDSGSQTGGKSTDRSRQRLERLAFDDIVWYLCAMLQDVLKFSSNRGDLSETILAIYNTHRTGSTVVSGMLLGLLEQNW